MTDALKDRLLRFRSVTIPALEELDAELVWERHDRFTGKHVDVPFLRLRLRYSDRIGPGIGDLPFFLWGQSSATPKSFELECDLSDLDLLQQRLGEGAKCYSMHPRLKRWAMTRSKDLAQAVEKAKGEIPELDLRFLPSGANKELKRLFEELERLHIRGGIANDGASPDRADHCFLPGSAQDSVVIPADAGSAKSSLAKLFHERAFAEWQARPTNEPLSRVFSEIRPALPTAERVGEEALRARVSELEQKLAEAENINRVQRSRLSEKRRAAATANRINDQLQQRLDELQKRLDRQIDLINERAQLTTWH